MEDLHIPIHPPPNSKTRRFAGSGSGSSFVDPDVIEIPPPATWKSKRHKQKSIVDHEVIVLDGDDPADDVIIDEKDALNGKGKKPMLNYLAGHELVANDGVSSQAANDFNKENSSSHVSFIDDDFEFARMDPIDALYDDECAILQAHFDSVDIPSGVEATLPWWPFSADSEKQAVTASSCSVFGTQTGSTIAALEVNKFQSWSSFKPKPVKQFSFKSSFDEPKLPPSGLPTNSGSHVQASGMIPPMPQWPLAPAHGPKKPVTLSPPYNLYPFTGSMYVQGWQNASQGNANPSMGPVTVTSSPSAFSPFMPGPRVHDPSLRLGDGISAGIRLPSSHKKVDGSENSVLKKLELFKKFDTLSDHSGHFYSNSKESCKQSKSWVHKIGDEWRMLKKDLPDMIFVRVYEARMDLLRAVIVGADGTPYHDGLFFFDVNFTPSYPNAPPLVNYHAHGLRINPNLYDNGKVCLSLLGTWSGSGAENWRPGKSNMLQVLVSIQGLILNAEPYYNEPGYEVYKNRSDGRKKSTDYSENTFLRSLKTMLYTMRNPPKYFEDFVFGHFYKRAHDILAACRAYLDGAEVGSFVKGKSLDEQVKGKACSELLRMNLPTLINSLVEAFTNIGVNDCKRYLVPVDKGAFPTTESSSSVLVP